MKLFFVSLFSISFFLPSRSCAQSTSMSGWYSGVALYSFSGVTFETALKKADSTGSRYIEGFSWIKMSESFAGKTLGELTTEEATKAKNLLRKYRLTMPSIYIGGAKGVEEWKHYFEIAKAFGATQLTGEPPLSQLDIVDSLAGVYQMKFAIHEHKRGSSIYWHPYIVLAAIGEHKNIGACADVGHWIRSGLNVLECVRTLKGHILEMHLKDINDTEKDVDLGEGKVGFPAVIQELKSQEFRGYMYIEYERRFVDNISDIKKECAWINNLLNK